MGKPMPVQRPRSKMDTLIFMTESMKKTNDDVESSSRITQHASVAGTAETEPQGTANDPDIESSSMQRPADLYKAIFSDGSDDDMDEPLNNQPVDPIKTSEGANMALNRLVAEDFLESLGKELGLDVPSEKPAPQNVLFIPETLSTADTSVPSRIGKLTTCREIKENENSLDMVEIANANADCPSANVEKLDLKYEKTEHRAEKGRSSHHHTQNGSPVSDSSEQHRSSKRRSRHQIWSGTPDSDSSSERYVSNKRKSHSRPRTGSSRTPGADSSSDSQQNKRKRQEKRHHRTHTPDTNSSDHAYKERYKSSSRRSSDKDRSRKHSRHRRHGRKDPAEYS